MSESFYKTDFIQSVLANRRRKRVDFVLSRVQICPGMSILDIGCGPNGRSFEDHIPNDYKVTGIDILDNEEVLTKHPNFAYFKQNARDLSRFKDNQFDLAVSFGMMEHVCDIGVLQLIADEIGRVSQQWVIVVPWKFAVIEPHFKFPFFQLFPYAIQVTLTKYLNLHDLRQAVSQNKDHIKNNYQWFTNKKWTNIFHADDCYICPTLDTIAIIKTA